MNGNYYDTLYDLEVRKRALKKMRKTVRKLVLKDLQRRAIVGGEPVFKRERGA